MRLHGKTVVITRAPNQAGELRDLLEKEGARVLLFPTIQILPPTDWSGCDRAIGSIYMYDGLLFSSANGVAGFMERVKSLGVGIEELKKKKIFIVGEATGKAVASYGLAVTAMPARFTAADLAKTIEQEDLRGSAFLFPTGNLTSTSLADTVNGSMPANSRNSSR